MFCFWYFKGIGCFCCTHSLHFGVLPYAIRIPLLFRVHNIFLSDFCFPFLFAKTFVANSDRYTVVSHDLEKPIRTRYLRIVPEEWQSYIALRAEFYGCKTSKITFFNCTFLIVFISAKLNQPDVLYSILTGFERMG